MMTQQFSLAHLTVLNSSPPEMTYLAARAGYDFVSFRPISLGTKNEQEYLLAEDKELMRQTKSALADTGIKLLDIELAKIYDGVDPKVYLPAMEVAAELGGRHVLTSGWTADRNFLIESYAQLCELAKPFGLTVDFEFVTWASVTTLKEAVDIVRSANCENCGIMVDTLHFHRSRVQLKELDDVPAQWFHYAHVCDAPSEIPSTKEELVYTGREERLYVGEGGIDIASILHRMPGVPYSLEIPHLKRSRELGNEEFARRCLKAAKNYLENHPRG